MSNACVKNKERSLSPSIVIALTTKVSGGGGGADENMIFSKTCVSWEYNNIAVLLGEGSQI